ncbi:MAG: hypothetical protein H0W89_02855 [Candidatus Levybacteria bacterium]|nr:hypothetical protein [Candidatus Levybacteria bacterium]
MHLLWWKIYFWLSVAITVLAVTFEISYPSESIGLLLFDAILLAGICVGIYAFLFRKTVLSPQFWKYFLWFNVAYSIIYLVYIFAPDAPYIEYLSFLSYSDEDQEISTFISLIVSIPAYYALYKLSKGEFYVTVKEVKNKVYSWNLLQIALWGYATVITGLLFLSTFLTSETTTTTASSSSSDSYLGVIIIAPILLFWLMIAVHYKRYQWKWWRITLVLNSILYSGLMVFGLLFAGPVTEMAETAEFDIIATLQFLIIFVGLIVFGREQFSKPEDYISSVAAIGK